MIGVLVNYTAGIGLKTNIPVRGRKQEHQIKHIKEVTQEIKNKYPRKGTETRLALIV